LSITSCTARVGASLPAAVVLCRYLQSLGFLLAGSRMRRSPCVASQCPVVCERKRDVQCCSLSDCAYQFERAAQGFDAVGETEDP
jgi:hypothetical protein